jgi:hypothetical protein
VLTLSAMELPAFVQRVIAWRWTPCVAPVMGSVLIALFTLAVIPEEIGGDATGTGPLALRSKRDATPGTASDEASALDATSGAATRHAGAVIGRAHAPAGAAPGAFAETTELPSEPSEPTPQAPSPKPPLPPAFTSPDSASTLPAIPTAGQPDTEPGLLPPPLAPAPSPAPPSPAP